MAKTPVSAAASGKSRVASHKAAPVAGKNGLKNGGKNPPKTGIKAGVKNGAKAKDDPRPAAKAKPAPAPAAAKAPAAKSMAKSAAKPDKAEPAPKVRKPRPDLNAKILHLISEEMAIEEAELTANASFKEDLNLDEIDVAELLMQAESSFDVHPFNEEDWESCETVGDFIAMVEKRLEAKRKKTGKGK